MTYSTLKINIHLCCLHIHVSYIDNQTVMTHYMSILHCNQYIRYNFLYICNDIDKTHILKSPDRGSFL